MTDFCMYLVLTLTALISNTFTLKSNMDESLSSGLQIGILTLNLLYLLFWLFKFAKLGLKHMKNAPKVHHIYRFLTCGLGTPSQNEP